MPKYEVKAVVYADNKDAANRILKDLGAEDIKVRPPKEDNK